MFLGHFSYLFPLRRLLLVAQTVPNWLIAARDKVALSEPFYCNQFRFSRTFPAFCPLSIDFHQNFYILSVNGFFRKLAHAILHNFYNFKHFRIRFPSLLTIDLFFSCLFSFHFSQFSNHLFYFLLFVSKHRISVNLFHFIMIFLTIFFFNSLLVDGGWRNISPPLVAR